MSLLASNLAFSYRPDRPVLRDVSLEAPAGSVTAIVGPNAAGKSTLLRVLLGILKPKRGRVTLAGDDIHALSARDRARRIAYIAQRSAVAFPFTVHQVVSMGRYATSGRDDDHAVAAALASVGLADRAHDVFGILSAGQQQRVALARALAQLDGSPAPRLLLADEPAAAMDPRHSLETMTAFRALAQAGACVLVVLHDLNLAARFADRAVVLSGEGRVVREGPVRDALDPAVLERVYAVRFERSAEPALIPILPR